MKTLSISRRILLVGVLMLTFGSCQDDFNAPPGTTGPTLAAAMAADANFNLWTAITQRVGIYSSLNNNSSGMVTVFAPSDPALTTYLANFYLALPLPQPVTEASLLTFIDGLSSTSNPTLSSFTSAMVPIFNYHMVSSKLTSNLITGTQTFATLNGARLSISKSGSIVYLNGNHPTSGATVTNFDLMGTNGVAHTIDRVMSSVVAVATVLTPLELSINYGTNPPTITKTAPEFDATTTDFDLLAALLRYTGQVPTILPNATPLPDFTVFRPTDAMITAYMNAINPALVTEADCGAYIASLAGATPPPTPNPTLAQLTTLAQYHVVPGRYLTQDLTNGQALVTLLTGSVITVSVAPGPPAIYTLQDLNAAADPTITTGNTLTNSGVLHAISAVLRPN